MANEDPGAAGAGGTNTNVPGGTPGGTPPPPPAPPLPPTSAGGAPPPPAPPARKPQQNQQRNGNGQQQRKEKPFDKDRNWRKRLDQEAARVIQRKLGCTLEEAIAKLAAMPAAGAPGAGGAPPAGTPPGTPAPTALTAAQQQELEEAQARIKKLKKIVKRTKRTAEAEKVRAEQIGDARVAGIPDQYMNFALSESDRLFEVYSIDPSKVAPEVKAAFDRDPEIDGRAVFAYIRKTCMPDVKPAAVPLDLSTAPPGSTEPGGAPPPPAPPGTKPKPFDANDLSPEEWRRQKRSLGIYG